LQPAQLLTSYLNFEFQCRNAGYFKFRYLLQLITYKSMGILCSVILEAVGFIVIMLLKYKQGLLPTLFLGNNVYLSCSFRCALSDRV